MGPLDLDPSVPAARVVRSAGAVVAPPRTPLAAQLRETFAPLRQGVVAHGRDALALVIGLWPLTAIVLVATALIWSAGYSSP